MSDQKGSDSPSYIQRYASLMGLGSIDANLPALRDNEGKLKAEQRFLLEMLEDLRRLEETYCDDPTRGKEIQLCSSLIEELLSSENWQAPISEANSFFTLYLGYLFGRMTLPSKNRYNQAREVGLEAFEVAAERYKGGKIKNAETEWIKSQVYDYYDQHKDSFKSLRQAAKEIAKREPVSFRTIYDWLRSRK
ncbi:hypothetical protein JNO04_06400 [Halomonas sp. MC140]|nr:hypothetical protein [Halomonas sp. MC140]MDN7131978.1 hypothetical protein [Halomonas sp. MC140]